MTATSTYTAIHRAFDGAARSKRTTPMNARVALAIHEAPAGRLDEQDLAGRLGVERAAARAMIGHALDAGLASRIGNQVRLTTRGTALAWGVRSLIRAAAASPAVAEAVERERQVEPPEQVLGQTTGVGW